MREHIGKVISGLYAVGESYSRLPPDSYYQGSHYGHTLTTWQFDGARLQEIYKPGVPRQRYIRVFGLGNSIPRTELDRLGVPAFANYPDLVFGTSSNMTGHFSIIPSETIGFAKTSRVVASLGAVQPCWLGVDADKYSSGIYQEIIEGRQRTGKIEVTDELPATEEACLSVAQLLVSHELALWAAEETE